MTLPPTSPLGKLLYVRQKDEEFSRMRRLGALLGPFHLKYTVTSLVDGRKVVVNGRPVVNFASFNYLGLEQHPDVRAAAKFAIDTLGMHSGCSRVFTSQSNILELEQSISEMVGAEATLIGHNVSQIHAGVIPALFGNHESVLFLDRYAHTSIHQACQIAKAKGARVIRVDASDVEGLRATLRRERPMHGTLLVDGVYSMHGHIPQLKELEALCRERGVVLYVDDAHGIGVFGASGGGVREACNLKFDNLLLIGSLQKGLGSYGGFVSGPAALIHFLRVTSKAYIFSGTLQPAAVAGAIEAIRISRSTEGAELRSRLSDHSRAVRARLRKMGYSVPEGDSPIVPVLIGSDISTLMAGRKIFDLGIYLNSVLFPAVPRDEGILRISLTSLHSEEDIATLIDAFGKLKGYLEKYENPLRKAAHLTMEIVKAKWHGNKYAGL